MSYFFSDIQTTRNVPAQMGPAAGHLGEVQVVVSISDEVAGFLNCCDPSSCTRILGSTPTLTTVSPRNILGGKERLVYEANNRITICEPNI
jgi:hypothetical protein